MSLSDDNVVAVEYDDAGGVKFEVTTDDVSSTTLEDAPNYGHVRPVVSGVSEGGLNSATASYFPVEVTDLTRGKWDPSVEEGDHLRVCPAHTYGGLGRPVTQPTMAHGGSAADEVGRIVGASAAPVEAKSDVAVRTVTDPSSELAELDRAPAGIVRDLDESYYGREVVKVGCRTGVTEGEVLAVNATVEAFFLDSVRRLTGQLVTEKLTKGEDSGAVLLDKETNNLLGICAAGSDHISVFNTVAGIESELGITFCDP